MKERKVNLDLMKVILGLCVITIHSFDYFGTDNSLVNSLILTLLISCDGLFYMISGYFNLEKDFSSSTDIKKYYKNKFINVFFPFLAFILVWTIWDYIHATGTFNISEILSIYYRSIVDTSANGHLWFMYPLFGMLLSTPFLSKMLHHMDEKELKILWYIAIGYNVISYYFCRDIKIGFSVLCWIFEGWTIDYIAGYYYRHVIVKENKIKWTLLAIAGYIFTVMGSNSMLPIFRVFEDASSIQPMFTFFVIGCFMFWDKAVKINNEILKKAISFFSRNTYMVYLFHSRGIEYAVRKLSISSESIVSGLMVVFGAYVASLLMAYIANLCLKPVQKLMDKILVIK